MIKSLKKTARKEIYFGFAYVLAVDKYGPKRTIAVAPKKAMNVSDLDGGTKCKIIIIEKTAPKEVNIIIKIF